MWSLSRPNGLPLVETTSPVPLVGLGAGGWAGTLETGDNDVGPHIFEEILVFAGIVTGMGCITGIVITMLKYRRQKDLAGGGDLRQRLDELADRLNRIETAVDSTALEVERIAEGQRFTTRLLAERNGASALADKARTGGSATPH